MKKILLLLITCSSISLMGMDNQKQIVPLSTVTPPPHTASAANHSIPDYQYADKEEREERCQRIQSCPLKTVATLACVIACPLATVGDIITCCTCPDICNKREATRPCYNALMKSDRCTSMYFIPEFACCDLPCCPLVGQESILPPSARQCFSCTSTVYTNWERFICNLK